MKELRNILPTGNRFLTEVMFRLKRNAAVDGYIEFFPILKEEKVSLIKVFTAPENIFYNEKDFKI